MKTGKLLTGKDLAVKMQVPLGQEVCRLTRRFGRRPTLAVIRIGGRNHAQAAYLRSQERLASLLNIGYRLITLPARTNEARLLRVIQRLNRDAAVSAILVLMPVPRHIDVKHIMHHILPAKDAEGLHSENLGRLVMERDHVVPPTPGAIMTLLKSSRVNLAGREAVVVGHSQVVGRPLALMLLRELATTTVCHIATSRRGHLKKHVEKAEVLIVAVGKAGLIPGRWIRRGAIVVDVGLNRKGGRLAGDVDFEGARRRASLITPVPGGVGPLTVTILMKNVVECFKWQHGVGRHRI
ncbi:MAG: bifunctional 5,10-methylenetetrahydrofolate dehydrogenase/5,10-methenyltetrahydrofolate cyclohydrolase [Candidatus Omnitrophica bacterium]|nr:bifunctional 5,10-methylenetetrahydrofolate dehydrogenase/5,10-methenyltetrahydrofolate cyclohydrolase [Candidatus Omnitrophota bacterium]